MQFFASDNLHLFSFAKLHNFFYNLLSFVCFLWINGEKYHRMVVLCSFCFCFYMRFAWFCWILIQNGCNILRVFEFIYIWITLKNCLFLPLYFGVGNLSYNLRFSAAKLHFLFETTRLCLYFCYLFTSFPKIFFKMSRNLGKVLLLSKNNCIFA